MSEVDEKVRKTMEKKSMEEAENEDELHDYGGEEGKRLWMESGKKEEENRHHSDRREKGRSHSRSRSRSHSSGHSRHHHSHNHRHHH